MLISFNIIFNCLLLTTIHLIRSLDAVFAQNDKNWIPFDEKTLYLISDLNERTDWESADRICQQNNSNLVSIHDQEQNEFLINHTKHVNHEFWIGLLSDSRTHLWSDNTYFNYNNLINESNEQILLYQHKCVSFQSGSGLWKYSDCNNNNKFGFICQQFVHKISKNQPKIDLQEPNYESCLILGEGFEFGGHCYLFFDKIDQDWFGAQKECANYDGFSLLSIVSSIEMQFIRNYTLLNFNSSDFWTGVYAERNSSQMQFQWSDGSALNMTFWATNQPPIDWNQSSDTCVYQSRSTSEWTVDLCTQRRAFICKSNDKNKTSNAKNKAKYVCPTDPDFNWIDIDNDSDFCYWFSADFHSIPLKTTRNEAALKCRFRNSSLASIHSIKTLMKMKTKIKGNTWIGLTQTEQGIFKWDDSTALDFTNWDNKQNMSKSLDKKCVSVQPKNDLKWTLNQCFDKTNIFDFICETKKVENPIHSTTKTHRKKSTTKRGTPSDTTICTTNTPSEAVPTVNTTNTPSNNSYLIDKRSEGSGSGLSTLAKYGFGLLGLIVIISISINVYIVGKRVNYHNFFKRARKKKHAKPTNDRRLRADDILNSNDPNVVFSNIRLK